MKCLADQFLRHVGTVAVSRIDEVDANLWKPAQRGKCGISVGRRTPDALTSDPHGAEAEAIDRYGPDLKLAGSTSVDCVHCRSRCEWTWRKLDDLWRYRRSTRTITPHFSRHWTK